jgi:predicted CoA-binding protein
MNENIAAILSGATHIAVVGLSDKPYRTSYQIAETLLASGYTVWPVNPVLETWVGLPAYPDLASLPRPADIVNVFRRSEFVGAIVDEAIATGARSLWTQLGVIDYAAARRAEEAGLDVVMDRCIAVELAKRR